MTRFLVALAVQTALVSALILGPAWALNGSFAWPRGWLGVSSFFAAAALGGLWISRIDADLARERAAIPRPQTIADRLAPLLIAVSILAWFGVAAWDAHRLQLLPLPPAVSLCTGLATFAAGVAIVAWTLRTNSFAALVVKIQGERRQRVVDTGPYAWVRHPMYLGAMVFFAGLGLILGSLAAGLAAPLLIGLAFLPRIGIEEETLRRDLAGYADYQSRVRARLVPGIF